MVDGASSGCHRDGVAVYDRTLRRHLVIHVVDSSGWGRYQVGLQFLNHGEPRPLFADGPPFDDGALSLRSLGLGLSVYWMGPLVPGVDATRPPPIQRMWRRQEFSNPRQ